MRFEVEEVSVETTLVRQLSEEDCITFRDRYLVFRDYEIGAANYKLKAIWVVIAFKYSTGRSVTGVSLKQPTRSCSQCA